MDELFQPVRRMSLSQEARQQILERIADGRLAPQTRISELDLSRRLGVSRTPLHEAMVSLARDGLVVNLGRRGWLVSPISDAEAREIYPILGTLSALAVTLQESSIYGSLDGLRSLAERVESPSISNAEKIALEGEWYAAALSACQNRTLLDVFSVLRVRATRLELACSRQGWRRPAGELSGVVQCLERGERRQASRSLEMHWRDRGESIVTWLSRSRPPEFPEQVA